MALVRRRIDLKFTLGTGSYGEDGSDAVELSGLRVSASISKAGGTSMSDLNMRVYGMPLDVMNRLTILGQQLVSNRNNQVTVSAGNDEAGLSVCFEGTITEAWIDTRSSPEVSLIVVAHTGQFDAMKPVPPTSYRGGVDVATVMAGLAAQMNPPRRLENSGVSIQIADPYLHGTLRDQANAMMRAGDFNMLIDDQVLAIWPKGAARGTYVPLLSPETGMVGYPTYTQNGVQIVSVYNPSIVFGGNIEVETQLTPAAGTWNVFSVLHDLESETPGGRWFTRMECSLLGHETPIG